MQRDEGAGAQPEYVVSIGSFEDRIQVFNFFLDAVVVAKWPAQTTAAAIWNIDCERIGQKNTKLHVALRGTSASMNENNSRATAQLTITNNGSVTGGH